MFRPIAALSLLIIPLAAYAKSERTYFTDERIAIGRQNVERYEWARKRKQHILEVGDEIKYYIGAKYTAANTFAKQTDEFLWTLQPPTTLPRVYDRGKAGGRTICPECGEKVLEISPWNCWRIDPVSHPYKVQCQRCRKWYPSNDFHKGDLTSGDYPDNGNGWTDGKRQYYFLREYAHMCYGTVVVPTLTSLSQAYLLTGNEQYAHKGCVLMARLASEYPNYGWKTVTPAPELENRFDRTFLGPFDNQHPDYSWKHGGMITDLIWETFQLEAITCAYDALYDHFIRDAELLEFVRSKGLPVETAEALRHYIEDYILRAGMVGLQQEEIHGNEGFHQAAALALALVMDDYSDTHPNSRDMVEYAYHGTGQAAYMMVNGLSRDGGGHESPNYNRIKTDFIRVAQLMEEVRQRHPDAYPEEHYPDIFAHPKARCLFDFYIDIVCNGYFLPSVGDCGGIREPPRIADGGPVRSYLNEENLFAFRKYGDPRFAWAAFDKKGAPLKPNLWEQHATEINQYADMPVHQAAPRRSRLFDGYGVAILESGEWPRSQAVVLNYASLIGHRQKDHLSLGVFARGVDLLPDLGYPRTWDYRWQWDSNNMAHNTVTVDETSYGFRPFQNAARLFASQDGIHVITAHHNPYPAGTRLGDPEAKPVDLFERTLIMVDINEDHFYVIDVFAVNGGEQHDQSWHAILVEPERPALNWANQEKGTLAGPDVEAFAPYTDKWGRAHNEGDFPCYLTHVRRAPLEHPATWTWNSGLPEGDALNLHIIPVGAPAEAIMGKGRSPAWPKEQYLDYLLVRRTVSNGGPSLFASILEPYQDTPVIETVECVNENPLTLRVSRADAVDTVVIEIPDGPSLTTLPRPIGVRYTSETNATTARDVRIGGKSPGYMRGTISEVDHPSHVIVVTPDEEDPHAYAPGRAIRIFNEHRTAMFSIKSVEPSDNTLRITLDATALLAQFPVTDVRNGALSLGAESSFATGHVAAQPGELPDELRGSSTLTDGRDDYFYGCRLGEHADAPVIKGIANTTPHWLHLMSPPGDEALRTAYQGKVVSLWNYGIGDRVEVACIETPLISEQ